MKNLLINLIKQVDLPVRGQLLLILLATLTLISCAALVRPNYQTELVKLRGGEFSLDPKHSFLLFKVNHLGLSTYVGRFNTIQATLDFDPANLAATRLDGVVEMSSIDTGDTELDELLMEPAWFDVAQFPQGTFTTTAIEEQDNSTFTIIGDLTLRGISQSVRMNGKFNGGADNLITRRYTIGFTATGSFNRSDFGIDNFSALVGDEVQLEIFAEFLKN